MGGNYHVNPSCQWVGSGVIKPETKCGASVEDERDIMIQFAIQCEQDFGGVVRDHGVGRIHCMLFRMPFLVMPDKATKREIWGRMSGLAGGVSGRFTRRGFPVRPYSHIGRCA
jgi:hypothetical protein